MQRTALEKFRSFLKKCSPTHSRTLLWIMLLAIILGIYMIATTVMIADDGVTYISNAKYFQTDFQNALTRHYPGYPCLIFLTHQLVSLFTKTDSLQSWIYCAQGLSLFCRVLTLVPLFFIGQNLVGSRKTLWGLFILVLLPAPLLFGSDVLREWCYLLFLTSAMAFLIGGFKKGHWPLFALTGLLTGIGYTVRPECGQILLYGTGWLIATAFISSCPAIGLSRRFVCLIALWLCFLAIAIPYIKMGNRILPEKLKRAISQQTVEPTHLPTASIPHDRISAAQANSKILTFIKAAGEILQNIAEIVEFIFVPPLVIGFYRYYRKRKKTFSTPHFLILCLLATYCLMLTLLYANYGYISQRHCLPIVVFSIFYIPVGIRMLALWATRCFNPTTKAACCYRQPFFLVYLAVGIGICGIILVRRLPLRKDKLGDRQAARWLTQNTPPQAIIYGPEKERMLFYANRSGITTPYNQNMLSGRWSERNTWYTVAATFDGETQILYLNGQPIASHNIAIRAIADKRKDGTVTLRGFGRSEKVNGTVVQYIRWYQTALPPEAIKQWADEQTWGKFEKDLIASWDFQPNTSPASGRRKKPLVQWKQQEPASLKAITILAKVKIEKDIEKTNWIIESPRKWRLGLNNTQMLFGIRGYRSNTSIPDEADYIVTTNDGKNMNEMMTFDRPTRQCYTAWSDPKDKKKKISIYEILED